MERIILPMDFSHLLGPAIEIAETAATLVLRVYSENFEVSSKGDQSPLTRADLESHECIVSGLQKLVPSFPVLSEEAAEIPFDERSAWTTYWLVDPLDGTKEFVKRNGEFTVNIALIHHHEPILGVVLAPVLGLLYTAVKGQGAYRREPGQVPVRIQMNVPPATPPRVIGSRSHGSAEYMEFLLKLGPYTLESVGSSLKFCRVAEGKADLYPRFGPTSEWDTAAAQIVVEEAGGTVTDLNGQVLRYNSKSSLKNPSFLVHVMGDPRWAKLAQTTALEPL